MLTASPCCIQQILKNKARAAIVRRVVGIGDSARNQIAANTRVIRLPLSIVAFANKGSCHRMLQPRHLRARTLVVVTRVLVKQRWQNRASEHSVGQPVCVVRPESLAISLGALRVIGRMSCLVDSRHKCSSKKLIGSIETFSAI